MKFNERRPKTVYLCIVHNTHTNNQGKWITAEGDVCIEVKKLTRKAIITQCPDCIKVQRRRDAFLSGRSLD
jgi:hypothetical protein